MKIPGYLAIIVYMHTVTGQDDCHCLNGNGCQNHVCNSGCNNGWSGPSCQRNNVALGGLAYLTSIGNQSSCNGVPCSPLGANLTMDGDIRTHNKSLCSKIGLNQESASLTVIFETPKLIDRIGLYFVDDYVKEMVDFQIMVDNGRQQRLCYQQPNTAPVASHVEIACEQQIVGIYVTVGLPPVNNIYRVLRLCEIEIYECADLWWGGQCAKKCNNCPGDTAYCNMRSGQCSTRDGTSSIPATTTSVASVKPKPTTSVTTSPTTVNISSTSFKIMETSVSTSSGESAKTTESTVSNHSDDIPILAIVVPSVIAVIIGVVVVIIATLRHRGYCCVKSKENTKDPHYAGLDRKPENNYTTLTPPTYQNEPGRNTYENVQIKLEGRHSYVNMVNG